ncbi:MAG: hypothetical protein NC489_19335 [Ruminococcus flavefaciens]|nr:hypothetical protein [Ruminococcus flavefaciens]
MTGKKEIGEILQQTHKINRQNRRIWTNYYHNYSSSSLLFDVIEGESTIVFGIQEGSIYRVFYYSYDNKELANCLKQTPNGAVIDIVTKEKDLNSGWLLSAGFLPYAVYGRFGHVLHTYEEELKQMTSQRMAPFYNENYGECATESDIKEIQDLIFDTFDEHADHLHFLSKELRSLIKKKWIWIQRDDGKICCIFIYNIQGKKIYYNLSINKSSADVLYSIQRKVLLNAITEFHVTYAYGWISLKNKSALKRNQYPSFDTYNHIFYKK